jgi:hypothetical protein
MKSPARAELEVMFEKSSTKRVPPQITEFPDYAAPLLTACRTLYGFAFAALSTDENRRSGKAFLCGNAHRMRVVSCGEEKARHRAGMYGFTKKMIGFVAERRTVVAHEMYAQPHKLTPAKPSARRSP